MAQDQTNICWPINRQYSIVTSAQVILCDFKQDKKSFLPYSVAQVGTWHQEDNSRKKTEQMKTSSIFLFGLKKTCRSCVVNLIPFNSMEAQQRSVHVLLYLWKVLWCDTRCEAVVISSRRDARQLSVVQPSAREAVFKWMDGRYDSLALPCSFINDCGSTSLIEARTSCCNFLNIWGSITVLGKAPEGSSLLSLYFK